VGVVFQHAALFPHLDVAGNLRYGLARASNGDRRLGFERVVAALGLELLLARSTTTLSGGERQRVAIARALLANPRLLVMDEPLASLDGPSRLAIVAELARLPRDFGVPMVYVTHAIDEAVRLGDRLLWLEGGSLKASGSVSELLGRLDFGVGLGDEAGSLIVARVVEHDERYHLTRLRSAWGTIHTHRLEAEIGSDVRLRVLARDVSIGLGPDERSSILNLFPARLGEVADGAPGETFLRLECPEDATQSLLALITRKSFDDLGLAPGTRVVARVKGVSVR
jgi:molybdate transport system ATP-binding protein